MCECYGRVEVEDKGSPTPNSLEGGEDEGDEEDTVSGVNIDSISADLLFLKSKKRTLTHLKAVVILRKANLQSYLC